MSAQQFCINLVEQKSVMLLPSSVYSFPGNNFRIGFARKNLPQALEKLAEFIQEYFYKQINGINLN